MSSTRLETLQQMVAQNPADPFARYGLAMEYRNTGDLEAAMTEFQALIATNPNYAAAYYHGGQTLLKQGKRDDAKALFQQGIEVTARTGDRHTQSELQSALDLLG